MSTDCARLAAALEDRYRLERELAQGVMATVYLAHDLTHDLMEQPFDELAAKAAR